MLGGAVVWLWSLGEAGAVSASGGGRSAVAAAVGTARLKLARAPYVAGSRDPAAAAAHKGRRHRPALPCELRSGRPLRRNLVAAWGEGFEGGPDEAM